jgi:predicted Zn-dependent protease
MMILTRSGWSGKGMVELFEMLGREASRNRENVDAFLSSHPSPQDRIENLSRVSQRLGGTRDSARFRSIKARISRLPASRPGDNP